jgi:hypothetical protein
VVKEIERLLTDSKKESAVECKVQQCGMIVSYNI